MAWLSLRGVIGVLAVLGPALVAVVTLTITLSASLSALRDMGRDHAAAVLRNANLQTTPVFQRPERMLRVLQNYTLSHALAHPSDDQSAFERLEALHHAVYLESEMGAGMGAIYTFYADNTIMTCYNLDRNRYHTGYLRPSSLQAALAANQSQTGGVGSASVFNRTSQVRISHSVTPSPTQSYFSGVGSLTWNQVLLPWTRGGQLNVYGAIGACSNRVMYDLHVGKLPNPSIGVFLPLGAPMFPMGNATTAGNLYGVPVYYLMIDEIDSFLASLRGTRGTRGTQSFAVDSGDVILASSVSLAFPHITAENVTGRRPTSAPSTLCMLTETWLSDMGDFVVCRTPRTRYGVETIRTLSYDIVHTETATVDLVLGLASANYFVASARVETTFAGVKLNIVLVMPEEDVIGNVVKSRNLSIGIACAVVFLVALVSVAIVSWVLSPLVVIAERMDHAADLEDDDPDRSLSPLHEIQALQAAYLAMNDELNRIRSFVPQSVLQSKAPLDDMDGAEMSTSVVELMDDTTSHSSRRSTAHQSSSRRSRGGRSSHGTAGKSLPLAPSSGTTALGCSVQSQLVTVLGIDAGGFHSASGHATSGATALSHMAELVELVTAELRRTNGVLERFQGDHFTATYNAVRTCPSHARQAVSAAWQITHAARDIGMKLSHFAGVSTGRCFVGNAGSEAVKTFAVLGPAYSQAVELQRRCRQYPGAVVLLSARTAEDVATAFEYCFVDCLANVPGTKRPMLAAAVTGMHPHGLGVHAASGRGDGGAAVSSDGEWLYVVGGSESQLNMAFQEYARGHLDVARTLLSSSDSRSKPSVVDPEGSTVTNAEVINHERVRESAMDRLRQLVTAAGARDDEPASA